MTLKFQTETLPEAHSLSTLSTGIAHSATHRHIHRIFTGRPADFHGPAQGFPARHPPVFHTLFTRKRKLNLTISFADSPAIHSVARSVPANRPDGTGH